MSAGHLLAIDSSTESLFLGVSGPGADALWAGAGGARASDLLLKQALALVREQGLLMAQLDAIAFASGPGAFTGLRTACAAAQGLALGLGCPVVSVDSLMIVAEAERLSQTAADAAFPDLAVVMDARMGEVYAGRYAWQAQAWLTLEAPALWRPQDLRAAWHAAPPQAWSGTGLPLLGMAGQPAAETGADGWRRAQALLNLARLQWAGGATVHPREAHPLYLRDKVALTTTERWAAANP